MPNKRKPRALKVLEGTLQKHRDNVDAPDYEPVSGALPPKWLKQGHALDEWARLVPLLEAKFVLTAPDLVALAHYCNYHGNVVDKWDADEAPSAAEITQLRMMMVEFGLTPASRAKVSSVGEAKKESVFAGLG